MELTRSENALTIEDMVVPGLSQALGQWKEEGCFVKGVSQVSTANWRRRLEVQRRVSSNFREPTSSLRTLVRRPIYGVPHSSWLRQIFWLQHMNNDMREAFLTGRKSKPVT
jgi:hypothetical protein